VYKSRLAREQGATLVRARWYGDDADVSGVYGDAAAARDDDDDDDDDDDVFLERKSHHESWSVDDSVKERFKLARRELAGFISGAIDPSARFASDASARALATEISRDEIEARRLTPSLRVDYRRAAFQVRSIQTYCISPISRFQHLIDRVYHLQLMTDEHFLYGTILRRRARTRFACRWTRSSRSRTREEEDLRGRRP